MCTVSFYKGADQVIITSNRDESSTRLLALPPTKITLENLTVYCPIDPQHNGTWFVVTQNKTVFVLLNGADKKHLSNPPYKKSRGLVLLEIADSLSFEDKWNSIDLENIENFTIVAYITGKLAVLRWNGTLKTCDYLDENKSYIWSSSTLYNQATSKKREEWFCDFMVQKNQVLSSEDLIDFHCHTKKEDSINGLIINRANSILTKNVTQVILSANQFELKHWDLIKNEKTRVAQSYL